LIAFTQKLVKMRGILDCLHTEACENEGHLGLPSHRKL